MSSAQSYPGSDVQARCLPPQHSVGERFTFNGRMILHSGIYLQRDAAERLLPLWESPSPEWRGLEPYAAELARQLRTAIEQHDTYWNALLEAAE